VEHFSTIFFGLLCQLHEENGAHGGGHRASVADGRNPRNPKNRTGMGVNLPTIPMRNPSGSSYKPQHTINSQFPFLLVKTCHNHIYLVKSQKHRKTNYKHIFYYILLLIGPLARSSIPPGFESWNVVDQVADEGPHKADQEARSPQRLRRLLPGGVASAGSACRRLRCIHRVLRVWRAGAVGIRPV
jgi:hypothetical protein